MLDNYKKICIGVAEMIPNWRSLDKNTLLDKYVEYRESNKLLADSYMAAIMVKYWGVITNYWTHSNTSATIEDCFEWFSHALLYTTGHRNTGIKRKFDGSISSIEFATPAWRNSKSSVYNKPDSANRTLIQCITSSRQIYYQSTNSDNRRMNLILDSIDRIKESCNDSEVLSISDNYDMTTNLWVKNLIKSAVTDHDYFKAFVLDGIFNGDVFDRTTYEPEIVPCTDYDNPYETIRVYDKKSNGVIIKPKSDEPIDHFKKLQFKAADIQFNPKKLLRHIKQFDENYCNIFSRTYSVDLKAVIKAANSFNKFTSVKMHKCLDLVLQDLRDNLSQDLLYN